jgi:hypothetical protein
MRLGWARTNHARRNRLEVPGLGGPRFDSLTLYSSSPLPFAAIFSSVEDSIRIGVAISSLLLFVPHVSNIGIQELILGDSQRRPPHLSALKSRVKAKTKKRSFYLL